MATIRNPGQNSKLKTTTIHIERAKHRISQGVLAKKVGTSKQTIHSIENGKCIAGVCLAVKIARFFGISVEELFPKENKLTERNNE